jgi:AraC family transcriptional regulator, arabinose operon regulatory protein
MMKSMPHYVVTDSFAGSVVYPPGGKYGPRVQQDLQLVLLHTGSMKVDIDGSLLNVPRGHVALLQPGHTEFFSFSETKQTWHRWIAVSVEALTQEAKRFFSGLPPYIPLSDRMNSITETMLLLEPKKESFRQVINDLGRAAIHLYICESELYFNETAQHPVVLSAKDYIHQHYEQELNLSVLAKEVNTTREHLIRLFKKEEGVTPTQYLWNYRVNRGLEFIRGTGLSFIEISNLCGFKTSFHFARCVKQHTGNTPSEIRSQSLQGE